MKNILLTSTGFSHEPVHTYARSLVESLKPRTCAVITTASPLKAQNEWAQLAARQMLEMGVESVDFFDLEELPAERLTAYDALYVNGGNTFRLLKAFNTPACRQAVMRHLEAGKLYVGVSAGSCVLGQDVAPLALTGMDENVVGIYETKGYGLFRSSIIPHFKPEYAAVLGATDYFPLCDGEAICMSVNTYAFDVIRLT